ncbi:MAG TPA: SDR family oxidoreductase [Thermotogaceae bacterium]|nr:SDR family oxidoreductase [Thermotogaceae bacterium]
MDTVLVTGGAGFIGSHLVDELLRQEYGVIVVDNLSTGNVENLDPSALLYSWDIREFKSLEKLFQIHKPSYVFHLAAQISVSESTKDPKKDADINILGMLNLLELSVKYGVKKFIFSSSGGVMYGEDPERIPTPESCKENPISPYGISKLAGEKYLNFYSIEHDLEYVALRYSNVYGPRQNPHGEAGVVAIFTKRMLEGREVTIFGDGENVRDYIYVKDVVNANMLAMKRAKNVSLNIGTGIGTTVNELFNKLCKFIPEYSMKPVYAPPRPGDLRRSILDNTLAKEMLGWEPSWKLEDGLRETVEWFRGKD